MARRYTLEEVAKHNEEKDLWVVIHNGVYDVTRFLKEHPGGEEVLLNLAGSDGTECFEAIGHSAEAIQLRETYKIGEVTSESVGNNDYSQQGTSVSGTAASSGDDDHWDYVEHKEETSPWLPVFIGIGVVAYAVIFYYIL